jgi:hypothetical protein
MDRGTIEGQRKRHWLVNGADPALAAAATGILLARGYIDRDQYAAAEKYSMLQASIFDRPWRQLCVLRRKLGGGAKLELDDDELAQRRQALDQMHTKLTPEQRSTVQSVACYGILPMWFVAEREGLRAGKPLPVESVPSTMPKGEISKRVSHMTKKRRTNVEWPCRAWLMQINQTVERFIGQVNDSYFPTKGGRTKQDFLTELKMPIKVSVPVSATSSTCTTIMVSLPSRP